MVGDTAHTPDLVTIVIPVFNGADYLSAAIDSALAQTWPAVEVLVVDDGSDDAGHTLAIAKSYGDRIRLLHKANGGVATALNAGIKAMRGRWFSWLSHDDMYGPEKIATQIDALRDAPPDSIAFGDFAMIDANDKMLRIRNVTRGFDADRPLWAVLEGRINGCTLLIPRNVLIEAGGFRNDLPTTQDYELWFRLLRRHPLVAVPGARVSQRVHARQGSRSQRHLEEVGVLWREMLENISPAEMRHHGGSELAFLIRARRFLASSRYEAAQAAAEDLLGARLCGIRALLVWAAAGAQNPGPILSALRRTGLRTIQCVIVDLSPDAPASTALRVAAPADAICVRWPAKDVVFGLFSAAAAVGECDLVMLADATAPADPAFWRDGIECVLGEGGEGWLQATESGNGLLPPAFNGAALAPRAVRATLDRCIALGHRDAELTLGLVTRLRHAAHPHAAVAVATASERQAVPAPHPLLAGTRPGIWLLDGFNALHVRAPRAYARLRFLVEALFAARGLVDGPAYLAANPDVTDAGADPLLHYLRHGWREGRVARPYEAAGIRTATCAPDLDTGATQAHLLVLHAYGGGTLRYAELVADVLRRRGVRPVFAWGVDERELCISTSAPDQAEASFALPSTLDAAARKLRAMGVTRVDVLHAAGAENHLPDLLEALGVPYDVTLLDYHLLANEPHLVDGKALTAARGQDDELSAIGPMLRHDVPKLLTKAARLLACSRDLAARAQRLAPGLHVQAVRPPEPVRVEAFRVTPPSPIGADEPLRVLVLGHVAWTKGRDEVLALATHAKRHGLKLMFHQLGRYDEPIAPSEQIAAALQLHGGFRREDLFTIVGGIRPHLAWFPAQAPETYGFALSEAMAMGLPILARGIGAYPERLAGRAYTWVTPAEEHTTEFWVERMLALRDGGLALPADTAMPIGLPALVEDFYARCYLASNRMIGASAGHAAVVAPTDVDA